MILRSSLLGGCAGLGVVGVVLLIKTRLERRRDVEREYVSRFFARPCFVPAPPLPVRQQDDAYVGYKTLTVVARGGTLLFGAVIDPPYSVDATAHCPYANHEVPDQNCECGFYALIEPPTMEWEYGAFLAQVELFGRVIRAERGYRASRQRVLSIQARRTCRVGSCNNTAVGFEIWIPSTVMAVCEEHGGFGYATPADLAAQLGTEVRWME